MGRSYKLNIIKVEPNDDSHTICIVDTDLNIDFAPPLVTKYIIIIKNIIIIYDLKYRIISKNLSLYLR